MSTNSYTHAVICVGAPYGDDESGHVVSRHPSYASARQYCRQHYGGSPAALEHQIVELDSNGDWERGGCAQ